eukprot:scaffold48_cov311-Pinguiococcus_pyrenoidosus.AAC.69
MSHAPLTLAVAPIAPLTALLTALPFFPRCPPIRRMLCTRRRRRRRRGRRSVPDDALSHVCRRLFDSSVPEAASRICAPAFGLRRGALCTRRARGIRLGLRDLALLDLFRLQVRAGSR